MFGCIWWIYVVANLILLCSLKTYLSFEIGNNFVRKHGLSYSSLFFRRASEYPLFWISRTLVHFFNTFSFSLFFMNNFCIASCFFSATKLLRDSSKNLEHLFDGYPIGHIFGVFSQCRSKTWQTSHKGQQSLTKLNAKQATYMWKFSYSK